MRNSETQASTSEKEYAERIADELTAPATVPFLFALSLMHCKNVKVEDVEPPEKLSRSHRKKYGKPLLQYKVLKIDPMTRILESEGNISTDGMEKALHICRGHFKDFTDKGLFGKYYGSFWWSSFVRGAIEQGVVIKDYDIVAPEGSEKDELVRPEQYEAGVLIERDKVTATITKRPKQTKLREQLISAYQGRCAATGCSESSTIEACHIRSVEDCGPDEVNNAILLRSDIHDLWDDKKLYIEPNTYRMMIHPDVKEPKYCELRGRKLELPKDQNLWPNAEELEYHRSLCDF